ncbi:MAG: porin [Propionivibrio sp.]
MKEMQKRIITLAVASLLTGTAFAQSNVTVYGIIDVGYGYYGDAAADNTKSKSAIDAGQWKTSRIGFKGSEDLGNGVTANFQAEFKNPVDTADTLTARNSFVGLKSATLGEIRIGSVNSFHDNLLNATSGVFEFAGISQPTKVYIETTGSKETTDLKNAVAYYSPVWSGFQFKLGASTHADTGSDDVTPTGVTPTTGNERVYTAAIHYANGPLIAGATYETNEYQSFHNAPDIDSGSEYHLAAAYDFGIVRVNGAYGQTSYAQNTAAEHRDTRKQWLLGASTPIGAKGVLAASYAHATLSYDNASDDTSSFWGIGYLHALSKRTRLYAAYGDINQDKDNTYKSRFEGGISNKATDAVYQTAFNVGIRHDF